MNMITTSNTAQKTMSSREIADLTGKEHRNVMRDATNMLVKLYDVRDALKFEHIYLDSMNRKQTELLLPKRETLILVSGYSVELRARIIDRWQELEAQMAAAVPAIPTNFVEALRLAADAEEKRQAAEQRVKELEVPAAIQTVFENRKTKISVVEMAKRLSGVNNYPAVI